MPSPNWIAALATALLVAFQEPLRLDEGPLDNTSFLPLDPTANSALGRADALQGALREEGFQRANERRWLELFDLWHVALRDGAPDASCAPLPRSAEAAGGPAFADPDGSADPGLDRRRDGLEAAVFRRLRALPDGARELWTAHQTPLAEEAWSAARGERALLAQVERRFPATEAAARAALALCDAEFEAARPGAAAWWLERARDQARWLREPSPSQRGTWDGAFDAREEWIRTELQLRPAAPRDEWRTATRLASHGVFALDEPRRSGGGRRNLEPGMSVRPGLAFLDERQVLVHYSTGEQNQSLALYDLERGAQIGRTDLTFRLRDSGLAVGPLLEALEPPGWPLTLDTRERRVVLTVGRRGTTRGNALACLEVRPNIDPQAPPLLRTAWLWFDGRRIADADSNAAAREPLWLNSEFQPGARIVGDNVLAVVREYEAGEEGGSVNAREGASTQIRTWLAAFDLASGELVWRRWLGRGMEIQRSAGRFFGARSPAASASGLAAVGQRVLVNSNTGYSALVQAVDGRLDWALRTRRRPADERRWSGGAPAFDAALDAWLLAPADGDHLYWLRNGADLDGRGLFVAPPRPVASGAVLVGAHEGRALVLAPHGAERALSSWNALTGRTQVAAYLGADEFFTGEACVGGKRALYATQRGLYLIDLERELYLLDYAPLERPRILGRASFAAGGAVHAAGPWVCVLGPAALWVFEAR